MSPSGLAGGGTVHGKMVRWRAGVAGEEGLQFSLSSCTLSVNLCVKL
jgi:hypothetical protein